LKLQPAAYRDPRVSPDGNHIAFATDDGKKADIWVYDISGTSSVRRLTLDENNRYPVWSADGERIAFQSGREGDAGVFWQHADGNGTAERLTTPEKGTVHVPASFSPDGRRLLFDAATAADWSLMILSIDGRKVAPFGDVHSVEPINATFSPDGKWVAYTTRGPSTVSQIYVQAFPPSGQPYQITRSEGTNAHHPFWSRDGRVLYYIPAGTEFAFVNITTRPTFSFSDPIPLSRGPRGFIEGGPSFTRQNDAAADGRVIAIVRGSSASGPVGSPTQIQVVMNWTEELKARVPVR
jgi:Tol biopolymer transport system component